MATTSNISNSIAQRRDRDHEHLHRAHRGIREAVVNLCNKGSTLFFGGQVVNALTTYRQATSILEQWFHEKELSASCQVENKFHHQDDPYFYEGDEAKVKESSSNLVYTIYMTTSSKTPLVIIHQDDMHHPYFHQVDGVFCHHYHHIMSCPTDSLTDEAIATILLYNMGLLLLECEELLNAMEMFDLVRDLAENALSSCQINEEEGTPSVSATSTVLMLCVLCSQIGGLFMKLGLQAESQDAYGIAIVASNLYATNIGTSLSFCNSASTDIDAAAAA